MVYYVNVKMLFTEVIMKSFAGKASTTFSIILSVIFFVVCIFGAFILPTVVDILIEARDASGTAAPFDYAGRVSLYVMSYSLLLVLMLTDALLFILLIRVRHGLVFTPISISILNAASWSNMLLAAAFGAVGIYIHLSLVAGFLAFFLSLCLRVVKNVLEEAIEYKTENDYTV